MPQILEKENIIMRVSVGEAKIGDETLLLSTTLNGAPVIEFEDGTTIYWTWEELLDQAMKLKRKGSIDK